MYIFNMIKRKTVASKKIIEILTSSKKPLPVPTILKKLKEFDISPNKSTIYRILKMHIQKILFPKFHLKMALNTMKFQIVRTTHFQCNICEAIVFN